MEFGEKVRFLRESKGLTQEQLAEIANTTNITVSAIETGRVTRPWIVTVIDLAKALDITLDLLIKDVEFPHRVKKEG